MQRHTAQTRGTCRERQVSLADGFSEIFLVSLCGAFDLCVGKVSGAIFEVTVGETIGLS